MFRNLLSATEKRQLELLEQLSNENGCTMEELSSNLGYSIRTIRSDIDHFRKSFQDLFAIKLSKTNRWFIEEKYSLSVLHGINRIYKENINVQLLIMLMENRNMSIEEYARSLHSSYSSLFRNLKKVNALLKEYELSLTTKPLQIKGNVRQIRYFYSLLFWGILHKLPDGLTCSYLNELERFVKELKKDKLFDISVVAGEKLLYYMAISLASIERGNVDGDFISPVVIPPFLEDKLNSLFKHFSFDIPKSERDLLGFYILQYSKNKQEALLVTDRNIHNLYDAFQSYIQQLSERTSIHLPKKALFLSEITWRAVHKLHYSGGSCLVGPIFQRDMVESAGLKYTDFGRIANGLLKEYPLIEETITTNTDSFIYWLITHWDGFFEEVSRLSEKTKILVISELGSAQEKFLCNLIQHEFPFNVSCYTKQDSDVSHNPPDIVLTDTYSMEVLNVGMQAQHVVVIDYGHMKKMLQKIDRIISSDNTNECT